MGRMIVNIGGVLLQGVLPTDGSDPLVPIGQPIEWPRGAAGGIKLTVVNELSAPIDLSAATVTMSLRHADTDPALELHVSATGASDGTCTLPLVAANTSSLTQDIHRADFWVTIAGVASQVVPGSDFTIAEAIGP